MRPDTIVSRRCSTVLALALGLGVSPTLATAATAATVTIVNGDGAGEGFNDPTPVSPVTGNPATTLGGQRLHVFQQAGEVWGAILDSDVTVRVHAEMNSLQCGASSGILGSAGPDAVFADFGAGVADTWYAVALANALSGEDQDPGFDDIVAEFNSDLDDDPGCLVGTDWFYGIGVPPPAGDVDFFSTVLHELGHGLGFLSLVSLSTGAKFQGSDDIYSNFLEDHSTGKQWPEMSNTERRTSSTDTGDLHWTGPLAIAAGAALSAGVHASDHIRMFAPNPVQSGSSVSHWDTALSPDELMEPFDTDSEQDIVTTSLLADLGWPLLGAGGGECTPNATTLCIDDVSGDQRFEVTVFIDTVQNGGIEKFASAVSLTSVGVTRGGLFFFNNAANPEVLIKVLNGCSVNDRYWVFWSAGTNVGLEITVTDTSDGTVRTYVNPDLQAADPVQDTNAFVCD